MNEKELAKKISKWIANTVEGFCQSILAEYADYISVWILDEDIQIAIGFAYGYSPLANDKYIMCPNDVKEALINHTCCYGLSIKICEHENSSYEDMCMPYYRDTHDTYDTDMGITYHSDGNYLTLAQGFVKNYKKMCKLFANGEIMFIY